MLLWEAIVDPLLSKYSIIVLDEVHEWTISTDVLMALVKGMQKEQRPDLKIILMSATIDVPKVSKYFGVEKVIQVEGWTHPVEVYNMCWEHTNYIDTCFASILQIHTEEPDKGDILVFMTG